MHVKIAVLIRYSTSKKKKEAERVMLFAKVNIIFEFWQLKKDNRHIKIVEILPAGKGNGMYKK